MNIKNFKRAIKHFEQMPEHHFDFDFFIEHPSTLAYEQWAGSEYPKGSKSTMLLGTCLFTQDGEVPCGTTACVAGEIYLQFSTRKDREEMAALLERNNGNFNPAATFAKEFLHINTKTAIKLFYNSSIYTKSRDYYEEEVTLEQVVRVFKEMVKREKKRRRR